MWWLLAAWIAGVFVQLCSWQQALSALVLLTFLWLLPACRRSRLAPLLLVFIGLALSQLFLDRQLDRWLPTSLNGVTLTISAQVTDLPVTRPASGHRPASLRLELTKVRLLEQAQSWPGEHRISLSDYGAHHYQPGDRLVLKVRLFRPRGFVNQGSVDRARLALARGEDASGSIKALLQQTPGFAPVDQLRARISERIRRLLVDHPQAAALVPALVVGDWRYLTPESWALYQQSGVAHLVVISGEHLTLVAGLVWLLLRFACVPLLLWRGWHISAQQWALLPALLLAGGYCLLAGWSVSTLRALIMLAVWFLCRLLRWRWPRQRVLALALLAVLIWQPLAPLGNGFWLSFLAVAALMLVVDSRPNLMSLQCLMSLVLGALAAFLFSQWGLVSVLANLLLIPLFSFVLVPGALLGTLVPGLGWLLPLLAPLVHWQERLLAWLLSGSPSLPIPADVLSCALLMLALLLLLVRFLPWPRWALPFLLLPWLWPSQPVPPLGDFELVMFDVGQGQATLVRTHEGLVLYDLGPAWSRSDAGASVITPWLLKQRQPILLTFVSHGDKDHSGGLRSLAKRLPAGRLYSGEPWRVAGSKACVAGQHWRFSAVDFRVLWPPAGLQLPSDNAYSCVLKVTGRHGRLLLTGDIPKQVEFWLAGHAQLHADVLQLAHHGSASSNSHAFLRAVAPELALVSVGFMNHFGQPADAVGRRLRALDIPLLRTDRDGMLRLGFDDQGHWQATYLRSRRRPWEDMDAGWPSLRQLHNE